MTTHSAIYGPAGPHQTDAVRFLLDEDATAGAESWVIDLGAEGIDGWAGKTSWVTGDLTGARRMLSAAYAVDDNIRVTITIEGADRVLADQPCRVLTEQAMRRPNITVRLVVPDLTCRSFGESTFIRAQITAGSRYATSLAVA